MRVLMFDASDRGGIATYTDRLADALEREGVDVRVCAPGLRARGAPELRARLWGDAQTSRARLYRARAVEALGGTATILRAVRATNPDVVHLQTRVAPRVDPLLLRLVRRWVPVVVTVHDAEPLEGGRGTLAQRVALWSAADAVIVHAKLAREHVLRAAPGVRVLVLTYDVPIAAHLPSRDEARARLGVPADRRVALMFGLLRPYKGLDLLADAWPAVAATDGRAWLYVVGAGGEGLDAVTRLRTSPNCEVRRGFVGEDEVDAWLAASDVTVLPYSKGVYSAVLHRALSHGTPSIVSPGLAEQAEHFRAGPVVPLDSAAWTEAMRDALGRAPLPRPAAPDGTVTARGTVAIYRELAMRQGRRH